MKKTIFYFIHVPWGWIKQRPHFIAEGLAEEFEVDVHFLCSYSKKNLINNAVSGVTLKSIFRLPYSRFKWIEYLNNFLILYQLRKNIANYDYIWLTHPSLYTYIKNCISDKQIVVYDCMDDHLEFIQVKNSNRILKNIKASEESLIHRAELIISSAVSLKERLEERYETNAIIHVVNNAINILPESVQSDVPIGISSYLATTPRQIVMYIGTVSSWIDWDLINESLVKFNNIEYVFIGPCDTIIPTNERIKHFGSVQHSCIFKLMNYADVLVMPFILNELIKCVNPVKVYEYIYANKPVIVKRYQETLKFSEFVNLYDDNLHYLELLSNILEGKLSIQKTRLECQDFALSNTWKNRMIEIFFLLTTFRKNNT